MPLFSPLPSSIRAALAAALLLVAGTASADSLASLENFMRGTQGGRADFTQTVTAPGKDGQPPRVKNSTGTFAFQRPNRFRFVYQKPFEQTLVADGQTLWLYDVDLNQVTARKQAQVLGSTPAAVIASAADLKALEKDFELKAEPDQGGLQWVTATPKAKDGQLQSIRVGLKGDQLAALDITDNFGQRSVLNFSNVQAVATLPAGTFDFKPPAGADVIRQ